MRIHSNRGGANMQNDGLRFLQYLLFCFWSKSSLVQLEELHAGSKFRRVYVPRHGRPGPVLHDVPIFVSHESYNGTHRDSAGIMCSWVSGRWHFSHCGYDSHTRHLRLSKVFGVSNYTLHCIWCCRSFFWPFLMQQRGLHCRDSSGRHFSHQRWRRDSTGHRTAQ